MHELAGGKTCRTSAVHPKPKLLELYKKSNQIFKCELVEEKKPPKPMVSFYTTGKFIDFCRGPTSFHQAHPGIQTNEVARRLLEGPEGIRSCSASMPYFLHAKRARRHLHRIEEAKPRTPQAWHGARPLSIQEEAGPGLIFWHPKGGLSSQYYRDLAARRLQNAGYDLVIRPHIMRLDLWKTSGHTIITKTACRRGGSEKARLQLKPIIVLGTF